MKGSVVTIGNFDGVHRGHQALLRRLKQVAARDNSPLVVMLFEPQPHEYFLKSKAPYRLSSFREKLKLLSAFGVEMVYCPRFNKMFSTYSPAFFIENEIVKTLGARFLLVGEDFRFGHARQGDITMLKSLGASYGIVVETFESVCIDQERVSSTRIRQVLVEGGCHLAEKLLGHHYTISGHVTYGQQVARSLGVPTANLLLHRTTPVSGVFVVAVTLPSQEKYLGVANVGIRPTFGGERRVLEVHLFNFSGCLYGQRLSVHFLKKIRDEQKFPSKAALISQIHCDIAQALAFLPHLPVPVAPFGDVTFG